MLCKMVSNKGIKPNTGYQGANMKKVYAKITKTVYTLARSVR